MTVADFLTFLSHKHRHRTFRDLLVRRKLLLLGRCRDRDRAHGLFWRGIAHIFLVYFFRRHKLVLEFFHQIEDIFERLKLLLNTLGLAVCANFQAEGERNRVERVLTTLVTIMLPVLEQLILRGDLLVILEVVRHLPKVVRETIEINGARSRCPSEVVVRLLIVGHFYPQVGSSFRHHTLYELCVITAEDLVLE